VTPFKAAFQPHVLAFDGIFARVIGRHTSPDVMVNELLKLIGADFGSTVFPQAMKFCRMSPNRHTLVIDRSRTTSSRFAVGRPALLEPYSSPCVS
jgi:hypothetical protein